MANELTGLRQQVFFDRYALKDEETGERIENTPEEIYDLINEFLEKSEDYQYSPLQLEFSRRRFIQGQKN